MDHNLVVIERPGNFEQYRWEVTCSCGWQGRGPSEAVAGSLGTSHGGTLPVKEKPKIVATTGPVTGGPVPVTPATPAVPVTPSKP